MSRVEILKCDGCGEVVDTSRPYQVSRLIVHAGEAHDLCSACVAGVKRFLQDHRAPAPDPRAGIKAELDAAGIPWVEDGPLSR